MHQKREKLYKIAEILRNIQLNAPAGLHIVNELNSIKRDGIGHWVKVEEDFEAR